MIKSTNKDMIWINKITFNYTSKILGPVLLTKITQSLSKERNKDTLPMSSLTKEWDSNLRNNIKKPKSILEIKSNRLISMILTNTSVRFNCKKAKLNKIKKNSTISYQDFSKTSKIRFKKRYFFYFSWASLKYNSLRNTKTL